MMNWLIPKAYARAESGGQWNWLNPVDSGQTVTVVRLANTGFKFVLLIAAVLAVIYLIYSGIIYITAAGNPDNAKKGQQGVINAIIGIIIIVAAFFIINLAMNIASGVAVGGVIQ